MQNNDSWFKAIFFKNEKDTLIWGVIKNGWIKGIYGIKKKKKLQSTK